MATTLIFTPNLWSPLEKFQRLWRSTYNLNVVQQKWLGGTKIHLDQAHLSLRQAELARPSLYMDIMQLRENGHSRNTNGRQVTSFVESTIGELQSALDCSHKLLKVLLPQELKRLEATFSWYDLLRRIRNENQHGVTGSVHLEEASGLMHYFHGGLVEAQKSALIVYDVGGWLRGAFLDVTKMIEHAFSTLNDELADVETDQTCCITDGLIFSRWVSPRQSLTFDSGRCQSWEWFDQPGAKTCVFSGSCGAYLNRLSTG